MPAHKWVEFGGTIDLPFHRLRRCELCGAEQEYTTEYLWMRVTGHKWTPKVGRCKGKKACQTS